MEIARRESAAQDLARCRAEHAAKRAREMRRIGESGRVSGVCDGLAARERARPTLQAQPKDIWSQGSPTSNL